MDDFKAWIEKNLEATFISEGVKNARSDGGYALTYTFNSDVMGPDVSRLIHNEYRDTPSCSHEHDCCGCEFLQSISVFNEVYPIANPVIAGSDSYACQFIIGRNV
jgi:hypothetical protein